MSGRVGVTRRSRSRYSTGIRPTRTEFDPCLITRALYDGRSVRYTGSGKRRPSTGEKDDEEKKARSGARPCVFVVAIKSTAFDTNRQSRPDTLLIRAVQCSRSGFLHGVAGEAYVK